MVGMCDGSAKFVSDGVDRNVWRGVGSMAGSEVTSSFND